MHCNQNRCAQRDFRKVVCGLAAALMFFAAPMDVNAFGLETMISECPRWVANADLFYSECKARARTFTRTFYPSGGSRGELEQNSVWFSTDSPNPHFFMGCQLLKSGNLGFLGIYYTAIPAAITEANSAPLIEVGFNGEAAIEIDGHPVAFTPVRPFDTGVVETRWRGRPDVNCNNPQTADGYYHAMSNGSSYFDLSLLKDQSKITWGVDDYRSTNVYIRLFSSGLSPQPIWYDQTKTVIINGDGSILFERDYFNKHCNLFNNLKKSHLLSKGLCLLIK